MSHHSSPFIDVWRRRRKLILPAILGLLFATAGTAGINATADTPAPQPGTPAAHEKVAPVTQNEPPEAEKCSFTATFSISPGLKATPVNQKVTAEDTQDKGACVDDDGKEVLTFTAVGQKLELVGHCANAVGYGTFTLSSTFTGESAAKQVPITWVGHATLDNGTMTLEGTATVTVPDLGVTDLPVTFKVDGSYPMDACTTDGATEVKIDKAKIEL
jgi:hypothetical protein